MRRFLLLITLFITLLLSVQASVEVAVDSNQNTGGKKFKTFFSLKPSDTIRSLSKITTSQDAVTPKTKKWGLEFGGFVSVDLFWDNRKMVGARDEAICLYPFNVNPDVNGRDIHATPSFNIVAMNTRLTLRIQAPDALGAKISGMVEGWFMGVTNADMNGFAMRHAFLKMDWKSTSLLFGQTWHPLFTEKCFAYTVAGTAGAPFQPFSRAPQIRLNQKFAKYSNVLFYINAQRDNLSWGKPSPSPEYLRNSALPEVGLQYIFDYKKYEEEKCKHELYIGLGGGYKHLIPRLTTAGNVYTKQGVNSAMLTLFGHYKQHISPEVAYGIKVKAALSQAGSEYLTLGGYAVRQYDDGRLNDSVNYKYTPLNVVSSWIDIYANIRSWEVALFAGYCQNLGSLQPIQDYRNTNSYVARGADIHYLYRVSARVKYNANKLQFGLEPEYTAVQYGSEMTNYGVPKNADPNAKLVHGIRVLFTTTLFF